MFYTNFETHEWRKNIIIYIHKGMFRVGNVLIMFENDMINMLISLCHDGRNLISEKNVKKLVYANLKTKLDGKNMRIELIEKIDF